MLTAESAFTLFLMLAIASLVYFVAKRYALPYTVLLTLVGVFLVPVSSFDTFGFLREFQLTPELLFFIFLPTLLFESAYNIDIRRVVDEFKPIVLLAVVGYLVSAFLVGGGLFFALAAIDFPVPFIVTLLFGALISATDPVAVLALFKEYGAPSRLSLLFEGESLMNDATALALFVIILGMLGSTLSGGAFVAGGALFLTMLAGGAVLGFLIGSVFVQLIGLFRDTEVVALTLMIVLAHSTFLVAELSNTVLQGAGISFLQFSPIIATTVASLMMGNYGRFKVTPNAEEFVEKFWSQFAFMANSIVFILVGFLFASVPAGADTLLVPTLVAVAVVALSRAFSIYATALPYNRFVAETKRIPRAWQHLLAWGSLRGALAVMLVLLVPETLTVPGWTLELSVRDFLLVLTVASIFTTLFLKAPTIPWIMRHLKIDTLTDIEKVASGEARAIIHGVAILKLRAFAEKHYIPEDIAARLLKEHESAFFAACDACKEEEYEKETRGIAERVLRLYLIGLEKEELKVLFAFNEVNERVFKRIHGKLTLQNEAIKGGDLTPDAVSERDERDFFENIAEKVRTLFVKDSPEKRGREDYLFYRAQKILAKKVLKELGALSRDFENPIFTAIALQRTRTLYEHYQARAHEHLQALVREHTGAIRELDEALALRSVYRIEERYLSRLHGRGLLSPKLFITLREEYEKKAAERQFKI